MGRLKEEEKRMTQEKPKWSKIVAGIEKKSLDQAIVNEETEKYSKIAKEIVDKYWKVKPFDHPNPYLLQFDIQKALEGK